MNNWKKNNLTGYYEWTGKTAGIDTRTKGMDYAISYKFGNGRQIKRFSSLQDAQENIRFYKYAELDPEIITVTSKKAFCNSPLCCLQRWLLAIGKRLYALSCLAGFSRKHRKHHPGSNQNEDKLP
jgi:hypothetical protein